jgi:hypothetical protein
MAKFKTEQEFFEGALKRFNKRHYKADTGCWLWTGLKDRDGYGLINSKNKNIRAHRWAAKYLKGLDIDDLCVCHSCDTPSCVNPEHLWIGTNADNNADRVAKGRTTRYNKRAIITPAGEFESIMLAAKHYKVADCTIVDWTKRYPNDYKFKEPYHMHKKRYGQLFDAGNSVHAA